MTTSEAPRHVLLDTHAFLWLLFEEARLSTRARGVLEDPEISKVLSIASLWEIAIKNSLGKLVLGMEFGDFMQEFVEERDLDLLPISPVHLNRLMALPYHHRDPFDRLIIAQGQAEELPILSADPHFESYPVTVLW